MNGSAFMLATAAIGALSLAILPGHRANGPDLPAMVRLEPAPFSHRLDGAWQRDGRVADAPVATVSIPAPVDVMALPVSNAQWMDCVAAGACLPPGGPTEDPALPVTGISRLDADAYAAWQSRRTGDTWRLPTDVEWAQAAGELFRDDALGVESDPANPARRWLREYEVESARSRDLDREIRPVGRLNVNAIGVHDIGGAVWEWTSTCLRRVEMDGAGTILRQNESCGISIAEGLHRAAIIDFVRDPKSGGCSVGVPPANLGFRLVREVR